MGLNDHINSYLHDRGIGNTLNSQGNQSTRNVYPALVVNTQDPAEQNRIVARIVSLDENGQIQGGRDKETPDDQLPFCIPLIPNHIHVRPLEGEMVVVVLENPKDNSAPRYWMGPVINSKLKLRYQSYEEASGIFDYTDFFTNKKLDNKPEASLKVPERSDIALQGRDDADVILKSREVVISAGKFKVDSFELNEQSPCQIQLVQNDPGADQPDRNPFSQQNFQANNLNLYSPFGKFRDVNEGGRIEDNEDLEFLGDLANSLHPAPFGDELIKVLDLIIRILLTHIHTPQEELVETDDSKELAQFTLDGRLQELISRHIRIN